MESIANLLIYVLSFVAVLTAIIYVHELGHYWVARWSGIRVETFSIGFGAELYGWTNKHGTRWKISAVPLGGYVKFFGDASAASTPGELDQMSTAERRVSFHHQRLGIRSAVVVAGPLSNFIFAILVYAGMFAIIGQPFTAPVVGDVVVGGAADLAGIRAGDRVVAVDDKAIERFEELPAYVALRAETPILMTVLRNGARIIINVTPRRVDVPDGFGGSHRVGQIGIKSGGVEFQRHGPVAAMGYAVRETVGVVGNTMLYLSRIVAGRESGDQLSGPLGIAKISGDVATRNPAALISLVATLSVAIGLINLFPIPMLDGGHLLYYGIEALRGRPLGERAQEYGFRVGLALVLSLFLFATWNDLNKLHVVSFITGLFS
jgi:regulator of sigma E protease